MFISFNCKAQISIDTIQIYKALANEILVKKYVQNKKTIEIIDNRNNYVFTLQDSLLRIESCKKKGSFVFDIRIVELSLNDSEITIGFISENEAYTYKGYAKFNIINNIPILNYISAVSMVR